MSIAKKVVTSTSITFLWADGSESVIQFSDYSADMNDHATSHGFSQKLGDSYSGAGSVTEAKAMLFEVHTALDEGDWNRKGGSNGGIWVKAMEKAAGSTFEEALAAWNALSDDGKKLIRKDVIVKQAKLELELEAAKSKASNATPFTL